MANILGVKKNSTVDAVDTNWAQIDIAAGLPTGIFHDLQITLLLLRLRMTGFLGSWIMYVIIQMMYDCVIHGHVNDRMAVEVLFDQI